MPNGHNFTLSSGLNAPVHHQDEDENLDPLGGTAEGLPPQSKMIVKPKHNLYGAANYPQMSQQQ